MTLTHGRQVLAGYDLNFARPRRIPNQHLLFLYRMAMDISRIHRKSESNLRNSSTEALGCPRHKQAESSHSKHLPLPRKSGLLGPPVENSPPRRSFSLLRLRNISDPSLGHKARKYDSRNLPPVPNPPSIIRTSPSLDMHNYTPGRGYFRTKSADNPAPIPVPSAVSGSRTLPTKVREGTSSLNGAIRMSKITFDEPERPGTVASSSMPSSYDDNGNTLALPPPRLSESSRSTASSGEQIAFTTTTTHTVSTTTTFWKIPRRKKTLQHLFPLPPKVEKEVPHATHTQVTPESDVVPKSASSSTVTIPPKSVASDDLQKASSTLAASTQVLAGPGTPILRSNSTSSSHSLRSNPTSSRKSTGLSRGRSLTLGHVEGNTSRNSISSLFGLRAKREGENVTAGELSRGSSPLPYRTGTMLSSVAASKERLIMPERRNDETPQVYLARMEKAVSKSVLASLLARSDDSFHVAVLNAYMSTFDFRDDPVDMALR